MTDASPVNRYLLFERCSDFQTNDKILYALNNDFSSKNEVGVKTSPEPALNSHLLVRNLEDLKKFISHSECNTLVSPSTDATRISPKMPTKSVGKAVCSQLLEESASRIDEPHPELLDVTEDLDAIPWDSSEEHLDSWSWPIETLYQNYHLCLALDFGRQTFDMCRNGSVYADRIPIIVESLLQVIKVTLQTRERDTNVLAKWIAANVIDEKAKELALRQLWNPKIAMTILLLNLPKVAHADVPFTPVSEFVAGKVTEIADHSSHSPKETVNFFPVDISPLLELSTQSTIDGPDTCSSIPFLNISDVRLLLEDDTFMGRLRDTLLLYESAYREKAHNWPESNLSSSLEYLIRLAPEAPRECYSVLFVTNTFPTSCSESLSFGEGVVLRKNLILSVVTLNFQFAFDTPQLSALAHFISSIGGFLVNIRYWLALASPRTNSDWCHRFEGTRCLAQQLFVQLIRHFPVSRYGVMEHHPFNEFEDRVPLVNPDWELEDLVISRCTPRNTLRAVAAARFNQGWSVLMDYKDEQTASHLFACYHHHTHRGVLTLYYEMDINYPLVYRRMFVSGTKVLVEDFLWAQSEELSAVSMGKANDNWLVYLNLLRLQISTWLRAEKLMLKLLDFSSTPAVSPSLSEALAAFSSADGVAMVWHSVSAINSMGMFLRYEDVPSHFFNFLARTILPSVSPVSAFAASRTILKSAMLRMHHMIGKEEDLTFVNKETTGVPLYIVQFFHINDSSSAEFMLASGFECRVSFFLCDVIKQREVLSDLIDSITGTLTDVPAVSVSKVTDASRTLTEVSIQQPLHSSASATPSASLASSLFGRLAVSMSLSSVNRQALLVSLIAISPRPLVLLSFCVERGKFVNPHIFSEPLFGSKSAPSSSSLLVPKLKPASAVSIQRALFTPYVITPWVLSKTLRERWVFSCPEVYPHTMHEAFVFLVMRRLHEGFKLLLCHTNALKAVLQIEKDDSVVVFDIIAVLEQHYLTVSRLVTPYKDSAKAEARRGIQEDLHIITTLHTFKAFSSLQQGNARHSMTSRETVRQGVTPISYCTEFLLEYLQPSHTQFLELASAPSLGSKGCQELREKLVYLIGVLGDHHVRLTTDSFRDNFSQLLSSSSTDISVMEETKVLVAVLHPIRYQTITFVLILENDTPAGTQTGLVKVALTSLSADVLRYGLVDQYRLEPTRKDLSRLPECIVDRAVLQSLHQILTNFASVFVIHQLTAVIQRVPMVEYSEETLLADIHKRLEALDSYVAEMDVSHLLYAIQNQCDAQSSDERLKATLMGLVVQQARVFRSDPFLFFPADLDKQVQDKGIAGYDSGFFPSESNAKDAMFPRELPIMMKIEALRSSTLQVNATGGNSGVTTSATDVCGTADSQRFWVSCEHLSTQQCDAIPLAENSTELNPFPHYSLRLRIFYKTVPLGMLDSCKDGDFRPPPATVSSTLSAFIYKNISQEAPANMAWGINTSAGAAPTINSGEDIVLDIFQTIQAANHEVSDTYFKESRPISGLPEILEKSLSSINDDLKRRIALYALQTSFYSSSFKQLESIINPRSAGSGEGVDSPAVEKCSDSAGGAATEEICSGKHSFLDCLSHEDPSIWPQISTLPGMTTLLTTVVKPALLSSICFQTVVFPVEFTQQATTHRSVDPVKAAVDVFKRCVDEDHMCVVPAGDFSHVFIPNRLFFAHRWVMVHLELHVSGWYSHRATILCYDALASSSERCASSSFSHQLRDHICKKITRISQLNLLKQLRDTQYANAELIPVLWGDQFGSGADHYDIGVNEFSARGEASGITPTPLSTSFCLRGQNILVIPIYYKLQHQCKKILSCISSNSSRLELITIFNREQCFMVADDDEGDTFHYIRLVFVKDVPYSASPTLPPPRLHASDRCPLLVVQLFTATTNASIKRPLQKLQDFCYFLAVQELQGHLSYIQQKQISFNDLVFLQNQPLDPLIIDLKELPYANEREQDRRTDAQFVAALLFLNLRENKFKHFEVQTKEQSHATSTFMEHYNLEGGIKQSTTTSAGVLATTPVVPSQLLTSSHISEKVAESDKKLTSENDRVLRFVRIIDGLTDVLVSCAVCLKSSKMDTIVIERYLTKIPSKRYLDSNLEDAILKQLSECVATTVAQLSFHILSKRLGILRMSDVLHTTELLMGVPMNVPLRDTFMLRYEFFSLDEASPAVFPYLIERLCGALTPYQPRCCEKRGTWYASVTQPVYGFPWKWVEARQNDSLLDQTEVFILCGYTILEDEGVPQPELQPVRVAPYSPADLPITTTTVEEANAVALEKHGLTHQSTMSWRILVRMSLTKGIYVCLFNLQDSEFIIRLMSHVLEDMLDKSALLHTILMQRLGYAIPSVFTGAELMPQYRKDISNALWKKPITIYNESYRRHPNNVRFRSHNDLADEPLWIVIEGLYNRGLIVNLTFSLEDAIKVLYDDSILYSLGDCERILFQYLEEGIFLEDTTTTLRPQLPLLHILHPREPNSRSIVCRLAVANCMPEDALAACNYRRHYITARMGVEAQSSRSCVAEILVQCDVLWRLGPQKNILDLGKSVIMLLLKSKQVFGSRVPDFWLRREHWSPEDDVLDTVLPTPSQQNTNYSYPVNMALLTYMRYLQKLYPSMCIIDLDPSNVAIASDPVLLNRLRCRYGKVTFNNGEVVCFSPHLYYAVIPFVDLLRCRCISKYHKSLLTLCGGNDAAVAPIASSGLFIVEVGLQVAHYALDFFVINGSSIPSSVTAMVATTFKENLIFDSIIYDTSLQYILSSCSFHTAMLPAHQDMATAVANLVHYYPSPPPKSTSVAAAYHITDPRLVQLRTLRSSGKQRHERTRAGGSTPAASQRAFMVLQPEKGRTLARGDPPRRYLYAGLIHWDTAQLFVFVTTEEEGVGARARGSHRRDVAALVTDAKRLLLQQLLESTQQERIDAAWEKFLCKPGDVSARSTDYDDLELILYHSQCVIASYYVARVQLLLGPIVLSGDLEALYYVCQRGFPDHVLRVLWRPIAPEAASYANDQGGDCGYFTNPTTRRVSSLSVADMETLFNPERNLARLILTFAPDNPEGNFFLALECQSTSTVDNPFIVESLSFYRRLSDTLPRFSPFLPIMDEENRLIKIFILLLTHTMQFAVMRSPLQYL
ncbi:unnamed protein product [Phytomonas sp. EM1]|nr:unnamed protein product [Phytomonas sp. EM1]|eukprot:CCW62475.1 unnamed protein product [Phytomonas sp. isolate EM1]